MGYLLGIDVGSGSARCGVFDSNAILLGAGKKSIAQHRPATNYVEQSSQNIWSAVCTAVKAALGEAGINGTDVAALSYSATCSLVLLDRENEPLSLSDGDEPWNVIMWMDHRAQLETEACNATASPVLRNLGGAMSVEMQIPKLMWVKRHRPDIWSRLGYAGDLADFLCLKSTDTLDRSACTIGCKWTYDPNVAGWNHNFLNDVGLEDLIDRASLPAQATAIGTHVGTLTPQAAKDLGLSESCAVGMGLIDAHAGALGTSGLAENDVETRLALIAGTSNCHIVLTKDRREVPGVWGPYAGAVMDGWYALEGGQSATGAALDQVLRMFNGAEDLGHNALGKMFMDGLANDPDFGSSICVLPDFLGNRSPFADPTRRGAILGLSLEDPATLLPKIYGATALGIAFGTKQIIEAMGLSGQPIQQIDLSGGHVQSELLVRLYADATGCALTLPACEEPVLLGAALAAAQSLDCHADFRKNAARQKGTTILPDPRNTEILAKRYALFAAHYPPLSQSAAKVAAAQ